MLKLLVCIHRASKHIESRIKPKSHLHIKLKLNIGRMFFPNKRPIAAWKLTSTNVLYIIWKFKKYMQQWNCATMQNLQIVIYPQN